LSPAEKHAMADSAWITRAHSMEPGAERQGNTSTTFQRTRSTQKEKLSIDDLEQIKASARRKMDSALLPASQRFVLSIDKELEEVLHAERQVSTGPAHRNVSRRRRLAPLTTPALRFCDEEQSSAPATFHDGKTIRRERFQQSMPESRQLLDGMTHGLEGIKTLRRSYPGAGLLLDLKQDYMAPEGRSQLRFEPETARQRGTYVFGLNGDIVKSRSLVASLPPTSTVDEEDLDNGQDASAANRARDVETKLDDRRSVHHARAGNAQAERQPDSASQTVKEFRDMYDSVTSRGSCPVQTVREKYSTAQVFSFGAGGACGWTIVKQGQIRVILAPN
jgi:hypothetical protein